MRNAQLNYRLLSWQLRISVVKKDALPEAQSRPLWRERSREEEDVSAWQGHHHLRRDGVDPHPDDEPHLPLTPDEIARDAIAAAEAGAAILHLHARDPKDGRPTPDPEVFMQFLPRIKQATNAVINITTGGGHGMTLRGAARGAAARQARDVLAATWAR